MNTSCDEHEICNIIEHDLNTNSITAENLESKDLEVVTLIVTERIKNFVTCVAFLKSLYNISQQTISFEKFKQHLIGWILNDIDEVSGFQYQNKENNTYYVQLIMSFVSNHKKSDRKYSPKITKLIQTKPILESPIRPKEASVIGLSISEVDKNLELNDILDTFYDDYISNKGTIEDLKNIMRKYVIHTILNIKNVTEYKEFIDVCSKNSASLIRDKIKDRYPIGIMLDNGIYTEDEVINIYCIDKLEIINNIDIAIYSGRILYKLYHPRIPYNIFLSQNAMIDIILIDEPYIKLIYNNSITDRGLIYRSIGEIPIRPPSL